MPHIPDAPEAPPADFESVTAEQWQTLGARRFYFGHQSVGGNLVAGMEEVLAEHPEIPLRIVEATTLDSASGPGLYHARIGRNGVPASKTDAFMAIVDGGDPGVGMLKYCYLDVTGDTDPAALFAEYRAAMDDLRARHPGLVIVHVTIPLTANDGRREWLKARLRGRATARDRNVLRSHYNALLRQAYVGKEPVFDLARLESTTSDGRRTFFNRNGEPVYYLAPEYTDDGGHLNALGRRVAAKELLAVLAGL